METTDERVHIEAPVGDVFSYVTNPDNWPTFVANLREIRELSSSQMEPGTTFTWEYGIDGSSLTGTGHVNQNVLNAKFSMSMDGSVEVTEAYTFTPAGEGTDLAVRISSAGSAGGHFEPEVLAREILGRVKSLCEQTRH